MNLHQRTGIGHSEPGRLLQDIDADVGLSAVPPLFWVAGKHLRHREYGADQPRDADRQDDLKTTRKHTFICYVIVSP